MIAEFEVGDIVTLARDTQKWLRDEYSLIIPKDIQGVVTEYQAMLGVTVDFGNKSFNGCYDEDEIVLYALIPQLMLFDEP